MNQKQKVSEGPMKIVQIRKHNKGLHEDIRNQEKTQDACIFLWERSNNAVPQEMWREKIKENESGVQVRWSDGA